KIFPSLNSSMTLRLSKRCSSRSAASGIFSLSSFQPALLGMDAQYADFVASRTWPSGDTRYWISLIARSFFVEDEATDTDSVHCTPPSFGTIALIGTPSFSSSSAAQAPTPGITHDSSFVSCEKTEDQGPIPDI